MAGQEFAEDKMGRAIDRCFSDGVIKAGRPKFNNFDLFVTSFRVIKIKIFQKNRSRIRPRRSVQLIFLQKENVAAFRWKFFWSRRRIQQL